MLEGSILLPDVKRCVGGFDYLGALTNYHVANADDLKIHWLDDEPPPPLTAAAPMPRLHPASRRQQADFRKIRSIATRVRRGQRQIQEGGMGPDEEIG